MTVKHGFAPVVDADTRLLVLGSLPGDASLAQDQYYAHRQNQFWRLMSAVIEVDLPPLAYAARLAALLEHGVGLWDVVARAQRDGSLDSGIRNHVHNDLPGLLAGLPRVNTIAFNGGTAARLGTRLLQGCAGQYRMITLPSSSAAHTLAFAEKSARWTALKGSF